MVTLNRGRKFNRSIQAFVDELTDVPLFYEHFLGSLLAKTQTPFTVEKAHEVTFQKLFLMMDRGYFAKSTAEALKNDEFAVSVPDNIKLVGEMIEQYAKKNMSDEKYYLPHEDAYGIHVPNTPL